MISLSRFQDIHLPPRKSMSSGMFIHKLNVILQMIGLQGNRLTDNLWLRSTAGCGAQLTAIRPYSSLLFKKGQLGTFREERGIWIMCFHGFSEHFAEVFRYLPLCPIRD